MEVKVTGSAFIHLKWSSAAIRKSVIPAENLYSPFHIRGSPFNTVVLPGAADYPYSEILTLPGKEYRHAIA